LIPRLDQAPFQLAPLLHTHLWDETEDRMKSSTRPRLLLVVTAALGLLVTGCGGKEPAASGPDGALTVTSPPAVANTPKLDLLDGKVFPIEAYKLTPAEQRQLNDAQTILANRCLARFGFTQTLAAPPPLDAHDPALSRRYGVTDPATAAQYGYHAPADPSGPASRPPAQALDQDYSAVLYGSSSGRKAEHNGAAVPDGGCMGEARRKLDSDAYEQLSNGGLAVQIERSAGQQAQSDARVAGKFAEWSACMKGKGFDYRDPFQPLDGDTLKTSLAQPAPTEQEIRTAVADVECKRQVNLVGVWYAVESAYEQKLIEKNQERLDQTKQAIDAMLKAASGVAG
jgi:hypothetical protein